MHLPAMSTVEWTSLVMLLSLCCSCQGLVSDGDILLEFRSNVVDKYNSLSTWGNAGEDPCGNYTLNNAFSKWEGVFCSNASGEVWKLDLTSFSLVGSDFSMLVKLKNLAVLDLSDNSFSGQIPSNIAELQNLGWLHLRDNLLTGSIPQLPLSVNYVRLQNNRLSGDIGLTNLFNVSIGYLFLQGNKFTGRLPADFPTSIVRLDVSNNQLEGTLPPGFVNLEWCMVSGNNFTGTIPDGPYPAWQDSSLVDLSNNDLTGTIPSSLLANPYVLRYLNLSRNSLGGNIKFNTSNDGLPYNMKFLDLSHNLLQGEVPPEIGKLMAPNLEYLCLQNNGLVGNLDSIFQGNFSKLRELRVGGNLLAIRSGLELLVTNTTFNFPLVQVMDLSGSGVQGGNFLSEVFRKDNVPFLRVLDLSDNFLMGPVPVSLFHLPKLRELRLRSSVLVGVLEVSRNWTNLEVLDLSHNSLKFNSSQMETLLNFPSLRELRLSHNNVYDSFTPSAALPTELGSGGSLQALEILDLSHLNLRGNISEAYSSPYILPSLKYLDLSQNELQGGVSAGFARMQSLTFLNLSQNRLSGQLPPLQSSLLQQTFFVGNEGLCGPPLQSCSVPRGLATWKIIVIVAVCGLLSGGSCLFLGWIWRRRIDAKKHEQDAELIATLLDKDTTSLMPFRELRKATDDFSNGNQIGEGGFGTVYRGTLADGTVVAIKKSKRDGSSSEDKCQFLNEVKILSQVHHRNLVRLLGCCLANKNALLVFEYVPNGTLHEHLHQEHGHTPLTWNQRLLIAIQTAHALDYLHSAANPPIYHLDVKSANILLDNSLNAKVADFGISKLAPASDATHITTLYGFRGTFGYMDPEMVVKSTLTGKSDVYAFGVVLLELITAKAVVDRKRGEDVSLVKWAGSCIQSGQLEELIDPTISDILSTLDGKESIHAVGALAQRCLTFQSEDRPSMKEVSADLLAIQQQSGAVPSRREQR